MHYKHAHNNDSYTQLPTDSALVRAYGHIVTRNKNNTNVTHLNAVTKSIVKIMENNTYSFVL